ncbi:hypothetical protein CDCE8392_2027 [Corynebacterium diphtheriae CDCE 8392]|nr:hypothetical protein CDCE8392_2027 [Corynebacterium diphtheriae CDCE 8392]
MMAAKKPHSWDNDQNIPLERHGRAGAVFLDTATLG